MRVNASCDVKDMSQSFSRQRPVTAETRLPQTEAQPTHQTQCVIALQPFPQGGNPCRAADAAKRPPRPGETLLPDLAFFFFFFFFSLIRRKSFCFGFSLSLSFTEPGGCQVGRVESLQSMWQVHLYCLSRFYIIITARYAPMSKQPLSESLICCWQLFLSSWLSLLFSLSSARCWVLTWYWHWVLTTGGADVRLAADFTSLRGAVAVPTESKMGEKKQTKNYPKP